MLKRWNLFRMVGGGRQKYIDSLIRIADCKKPVRYGANRTDLIIETTYIFLFKVKNLNTHRDKIHKTQHKREKKLTKINKLGQHLLKICRWGRFKYLVTISFTPHSTLLRSDNNFTNDNIKMVGDKANYWKQCKRGLEYTVSPSER